MTAEGHAAVAPSVVVFDVNETLSDLAPMEARFTEVGAPGHLATTWFASVLRDGFALAAAGTQAPFAQVAEAALRGLLARVPLSQGVDAAVERVMSGFARLPVHPDVPEGVRALRAAGLRLVTLSNGSAEVAERLLGSAGLRGEFEALLSVEDAGVWKPARRAYEHAARACATEPGSMVLVAVHPWDVDGAARAGMGTAWVDRAGTPYPGCFTPPRHTVTGLGELAGRLTSAAPR